MKFFALTHCKSSPSRSWNLSAHHRPASVARATERPATCNPALRRGSGGRQAPARGRRPQPPPAAPVRQRRPAPPLPTLAQYAREHFSESAWVQGLSARFRDNPDPSRTLHRTSPGGFASVRKRCPIPFTEGPGCCILPSANRPRIWTEPNPAAACYPGNAYAPRGKTASSTKNLHHKPTPRGIRKKFLLVVFRGAHQFTGFFVGCSGGWPLSVSLHGTPETASPSPWLGLAVSLKKCETRHRDS